MTRILTGACAWHAVVTGNGLLVRGALATWFGGAHDPMDDGRTASGVSTRDNPAIIGCALPMHGFSSVHSTAGSPLPRIPWKTPITVMIPDGRSLICPLIDVGPSLNTNHAIDLTVAAFEALGGELKCGRLSVDYLIPDGAKYL